MIQINRTSSNDNLSLPGCSIKPNDRRMKLSAASLRRMCRRAMNIFRFRSQSFNISESEETHKVKYLGNILTIFMKGEGCTDRPTTILWNNYLADSTCALDMDLTVSNSGLKVMTKEQGLTEYWANRIAYCISPQQFPKVFVWVYRHEGKKMKVEVRCHAALCRNEAIANAIDVQLHEKLAFALAEFMREKTRRQNSRLVLLQRTQSLPAIPSTVGSGVSARTKFLTLGQHFKPPSCHSTSAPKLLAINEDSNEMNESLAFPGQGHVRSSIKQLRSLPETDFNCMEGFEIPDEDENIFYPSSIFNACRPQETIPEEEDVIDSEEIKAEGNELNECPTKSLNEEEINNCNWLLQLEGNLLLKGSTDKKRSEEEVDVMMTTNESSDDLSDESGYSEQEINGL